MQRLQPVGARPHLDHEVEAALNALGGDGSRLLVSAWSLADEYGVPALRGRGVDEIARDTDCWLTMDVSSSGVAAIATKERAWRGPLASF